MRMLTCWPSGISRSTFTRAGEGWPRPFWIDEPWNEFVWNAPLISGPLAIVMACTTSRSYSPRQAELPRIQNAGDVEDLRIAAGDFDDVPVVESDVGFRIFNFLVGEDPQRNAAHALVLIFGVEGAAVNQHFVFAVQTRRAASVVQCGEHIVLAGFERHNRTDAAVDRGERPGIRRGNALAVVADPP